MAGLFRMTIEIEPFRLWTAFNGMEVQKLVKIIVFKRLALVWFFRNPFHNFTFYVIGVADKPRTFEYDKVWGKSDGFNLTFVEPLAGLFKGLRLPMLSYVGKKRGWYVGWRPYGSFGISLNFAGSYIAKRNSENK